MNSDKEKIFVWRPKKETVNYIWTSTNKDNEAQEQLLIRLHQAKKNGGVDVEAWLKNRYKYFSPSEFYYFNSSSQLQKAMTFCKYCGGQCFYKEKRKMGMGMTSYSKIDIECGACGYHQTIRRLLPVCQLCGGNFDFTEKPVPDFSSLTFRGYYDTKIECYSCGYWSEVQYYDTGQTGEMWEAKHSILREFSLNDSKLGMDELGAHIKGNFNDIYNLSPRRFELLVADIYKTLGYYVNITKQTRDGGYDILLIEKSNNEKILVECKRYKKSKKISVSTVRELVGVQFIQGINKAKLVTTSSFTGPALEVKNTLSRCQPYYSLDLVDASQLLEALQVYNKNLPSSDILSQIMKYNKKIQLTV